MTIPVRFGLALIASVVTFSLRAADVAPPAAVAAPPLNDRGSFRLSHCLVSLIDDVEVPARRAGVLLTLTVKEGDYLESGASLGAIDDAEARYQYGAAKADAEAAQSKADNPLEVEYATATYRTADAEHRISLAANQKQPGAVSVVEVEKLRLAADQARIKIAVGEFERRLRATEARGFDSKAQLALADVDQRRLVAPLAGEIVETFYRPGEWVEPGKPIVRMVRLDRLRVEAFVTFSERSPAGLADRPVEATVLCADGKTERFSGRITFVSPIVQPGGEYRIWAEVENRRENGHWLLRPGIEAEVTIR